MAAAVRAGTESLPVLQKPQMAGGKTEVNITAIELDASIQCRAVIDTGTVAEYAERRARCRVGGKVKRLPRTMKLARGSVVARQIRMKISQIE